MIPVLSISMAPWMWVVVALLSVVVWWRSRSRQRELSAAINTLATHRDIHTSTKEIVAGLGKPVIDAILKNLPTAITAQQIQEIAAARAENTRLRNELEWVRIGVIMHGVKSPLNKTTYAIVLFNIKTAALRPPEKKYRIYTDSEDYWNQETGTALKTPLGAPSWEYLDGGRLVMCGVVYHYRREKE